MSTKLPAGRALRKEEVVEIMSAESWAEIQHTYGSRDRDEIIDDIDYTGTLADQGYTYNDIIRLALAIYRLTRS